jgi:hypothetical protein
MANYRHHLFFGVFLLILLSMPVALKSSDAGSLEGVVTNDTGPLPDATVEAKNVVTGTVQRATTASDGKYRIDDLRPGKYSLWIHADGHTSEWVLHFVVESGQAVHKDVKLHRHHLSIGS